MRKICERYQENKKKLYYVFVDLKKGDGEMGFKGALYYDACTVVRTGAGLSESFKVKVGLHHGSVLNPLLFAVVMDIISSEARSGLSSELLYADNIVLMAPTNRALW